MSDLDRFREQAEAEGKPLVELDFETAWCAKHLEPFRAEWPDGAAVAMIYLAGAAMNDERIKAAAPKDAAGRAKVESLTAVLAEHTPLCCFIGDEALAEVYREAGKQPS